MATLDLSNATKGVAMTDPNLVGFGALEAATSSVWSYLTLMGHDLQLEGTGMTFDAQGRALSGTVQSLAIDVGNNDFDNPDIVITGINAAAATLDDGQASFWRFLEGDDTIVGPQFAKTGSAFLSEIFGDGIAARTGNTGGGHDLILHGDTRVHVNGDVQTVGSQTAGTPASVYQGGNDEIQGAATDFQQFLVGDAGNVFATGRLLGGNDSIFINSSSIGSVAIGDAYLVQGIAADRAEVFGGNDLIVAGPNSGAQLIGDVAIQAANSFVSGGDDRISGGEQRETIAGDIYALDGGEAVGGADVIFGNGGDDFLTGDTYSTASGAKLTGGNDRIYGGAGKDDIYGETGTNSAGTTGGNDRLFGEAGDDWVAGQTGDDLLDGGTGDDRLFGGTGNDTYVIDSGSDFVSENANEGIDLVKSYFGAVALKDNFEHLTFIGAGSFTGFGNGLDNTIKAGAGADNLNGLGGNDRLYGGAGDDGLFDDAGDDVLNGGAGGDNLVGGDGFDTASYAGSEQAVKVALNGSIQATGDAVDDTFNAIEGLQGSSFGDQLVGDANANRLDGGEGADLLYGGSGLDTLMGGDGIDLLNGGAGGDRLDGGAGTDRASYSLASSGVTASLANPSANTGEAQGDSYVSIEGLLGSKHADRLIGNGGANTITGGLGRDTLEGGLGADTFDFNAIAESSAGNRDVITDFNAGTATGFVDRIDLSGIDAKTNVTGDQAFTFIGTGSYTGVAGQLRVVQSGSGVGVLGDVNGDGVSDFQLTITNAVNLANLTAVDFIL